MVAIPYRMAAGIPGDINRIAAGIVEAQSITPAGTTGAPTTYGIPLVVDATSGNVGNMRAISSSDTTIYGLLARPYPTGGSQDPLGVSTPPTSGACDVLVRGYMTVLLAGSTAATKGGALYVWTAASSGAHVQGGFEAASSSGNTILVPGSYFMGPADTAGNTEIAFQM